MFLAAATVALRLLNELERSLLRSSPGTQVAVGLGDNQEHRIRSLHLAMPRQLGYTVLEDGSCTVRTTT